ncbi:MAG: ABC transporter permease [Candidatus Baltobacteraceae bacterium]|jgi:spermidine/putrescine transport system permease protein
MATLSRPLPAAVSLPTRLVDFLGRHVITFVALLSLVYLLAPIGMMIALSLNQTNGKFDFTWHGFSTAAWANPFAVDGLLPALKLSAVLAGTVTVIATPIGTAMAYALVRYKFRGQTLLDLVLLLTISTPEVILGSAMLDMFLNLRAPMGPFTLILAHVMFDIAFVVIMVKSRLRGFDITLEHAAMDLGARGWRVFYKITLPLILPSIVTAGILAFMLSLDDFIVSMFVSGQTVTFPLFVWGEARVAMPPQIYVIGTSIFLILAALMTGSLLLDRSRGRAQVSPVKAES